MKDKRLEELRERFHTMVEVITADAHALDGQPFNGRTTARTFGEIMAAQAATAEALEGILNHLLEVQATLVLLEAHQENLIERVYELEGGDG